MQTFEFNADVKNGFIELPDEYKDKVNKKVKVILLQSETDKLNEFNNLSIDLEERKKSIRKLIELSKKHRIKVDKLEIPDRSTRNER